ncbi:MAG: emrB [Verrucomicrobiaceae bacterium]|nr:emrB [Verrucomicrobiaceae bacterium]
MSAARAKPMLQGGALALLTLTIALSTFMEVLDISIVNVSVYTIAGDLGVSSTEGTWAISAYSLASAIMQPLTGWIARRFGEVRTFCISVLLFVVFSTLCGFATDMSMLVIFRLLQGLVSGPMVPLSQTLLLNNYPEKKRGLALALWAMTVVVAPIFGPILGGWITDNYSWPWIFFINVPIGIFAVITSYILLHDRESKTVKQRIDVVGLGLLVFGVGALQFMLDNGNDQDWFSSPFIVTLAIVAVVGIVFLIAWELTEKNPIVDLRLFRKRNFSVGVAALSVGMAAFFGTTVVLPQWLQRVMGYNATWAGVAVTPVGILAFLLSPLVGRYIKKIELRILTSFAFLIFSATAFWSAQFTDDVNYGYLILPRIVQGIGVACFFVPLQEIILSEMKPAQMAAASGLANFFRTLAQSVSTALTTTLYDHRSDFHHAVLAERIVRDRPQVEHFLQIIGTRANRAPASSYQALDQIVNAQAQTLAINDIFWLYGFIFVVIIGLIWLARPPFEGVGAPAG